MSRQECRVANHSGKDQSGDNDRRNFSDTVKVVDVPRVMQKQVPAIQKVQKTVEVPQVQYIDKVVDVQKTVKVPQVQFLDKVVDIPNVRQRQVPTIQRLQKKVEASQVQFIDQGVDVPLVMQRKVHTIQKVRRLSRFSRYNSLTKSWRCQSSGRDRSTRQRVQKTVEVPQKQFRRWTSQTEASSGSSGTNAVQRPGRFHKCSSWARLSTCPWWCNARCPGFRRAENSGGSAVAVRR